MPYRLLAFVCVFHVLVPYCQTTDDPISVDCEPLCQFEILEERWCALQRGCYEPDIKNDDQKFLQCWAPCWRSSTNCLSVCRAQHGAVKQKCAMQCASQNNNVCTSFCFAYEVDQLVHGTPKQPDVKPPGTATATDEAKATTTTPPEPAAPMPESDVIDADVTTSATSEE